MSLSLETDQSSRISSSASSACSPSSPSSCSSPKSFPFGEDRPCVILFEPFMECEKAREVFGHFLREEALNEEPMLFLQDLAKYELCYNDTIKMDLKNTKTEVKNRDLISKLYAKANEIISKYIQSNSPKELNLGSHQTHTLCTWSQIEVLTKQMSCQDRQVDFDLIERMHPSVLFKQAKLAVNVA